MVHLRNMLVIALFLFSGATVMPAALAETGAGQTLPRPAAHADGTLTRSCVDGYGVGPNATVRFAVDGASPLRASDLHFKPGSGNAVALALADQGYGTSTGMPCVVRVVATQVAANSVNRGGSAQGQPMLMHRREVDGGFVLPGSVIVLIVGVLGVVLVSRRPMPASRGNTKG